MLTQRTPAQRIPRRSLVAFGGIMLATLLAALDQSIVAPALPSIAADLGAVAQLPWVVTAFLLASTVTVPVYGKVSDLYGRRRLILVAMAIFLAGSVWCTVARSVPELIAARALQGLGAGGLLPLAQAAVGDLIPPRQRGRYQGFTGAVWATSALAGPLLGGALADAGSWRWIFGINIPLTVVAMVVVARTLPAHERAGQRAPFDYRGALVLSGAATCVLLAAGTTAGEVRPALLAALTGLGAVLVALFVRIERRAADPVLPLALFRVPVFAVAIAGVIVIGAIMYSVMTYVPLLVQEGLDGSATVAGAILMPMSIGWVVTSVTAGQLMARTGSYRPFPIAGSVVVLAGMWQLANVDGGTSHAAVAVASGMVGAGIGLGFQPYLVATQNAVDRALLGTATASILFFRTMGGSVAVAVLGAAFGDWSGATPDHAASVLSHVFLALVPVCVVGVVLALRLEHRPLAESVEGRS